MKTSHFLLVMSSLVLLGPALAAQPPSSATLPPTKVVLRVSRSFVHRLLGIKFVHDEPIASNSGGTMVTGHALASGKFDVQLHESKTSSEFDLRVDGDILTEITATRRPVRVVAHGAAPFTVCRRIVHTGDGFAGKAVSIHVSHQFHLDQICSFRGGLTGALTRAVARPIVRRGLLDGDAQAEQDIRASLSKSFEENGDQVIRVLNDAGVLAKQGFTALHKEKLVPGDLRIYRAATKDHLLLGVGRLDHRLPTLPKLDPKKQAPLELWIAKPADDATDYLALLKENWKPIKTLIHEQLRRRSPELAARLKADGPDFLERVHLETVEGWHVVTFAPKLVELPLIHVP